LSSLFDVYYFLDSIPSTSIIDVSSFRALPNSISFPASIHTDTNDSDIDILNRLVWIDQFEDPGLWPDIISQDFLTQITDHDAPIKLWILTFHYIQIIHVSQ